ncbi:MAG TPA: glycosyltransferase [Terriglobales bacterium]|jgi:glycosyltransferase involved in cell wall biosynthesis
MPKITALLHTHNDALRLGRALDSLRPCDEVLVIDDCSEDDTSRVAREHEATLKTAIPGVTLGAYAADASHDWVLCLHPSETLSDDLEAALFDWKNEEPAENIAGYRASIREQKDNEWQTCPPETRLINRKLVNWIGEMPPDEPCENKLSGDVLRFHQP